jgi:hypothetical protein
MYGRNGELGTTDLSFLEKATLIQICMGANDLGLVFDGPVRPTSNVMISSVFAIRLSDQSASQHELEEGHLLRPFLNRDVITANWAENGTLVLTFDKNDQILVLDNSDQFESYIITHGNTTIVI